MEELELREREKWVDAVKGLAIYLVILGHAIIIMQEIVFFKLYIAFICRYL